MLGRERQRTEDRYLAPKFIRQTDGGFIWGFEEKQEQQK